MSNESTEDIELKPCPFCGSKEIDASMVRGYQAGDMTQPIIAAGCWACGAIGKSVLVPDHSTGYQEAADAWNMRSHQEE